MKALLLEPADVTGLHPLSYSTPAPLLPLLGAPLATSLLRGLAGSGVSDAVFVCRERSSAYERFLLDGRPWGLNLAVLETGADVSTLISLQSVRSLGFHDQTLAVIPANCWTDANWPAMESAHRAGGGGVSELAVNGSPTGILLIDPGAPLSLAAPQLLPVNIEWRLVTNWREYWALARESMLNPSNGVAPAYAPHGGPLRMAPLARIDRDRCEISGPVWLGPGATVDPGAVLRGPVWVGANCRVGPGVTLDNCALEAATRLHGPLELRHTLVVANRAIALDESRIRILDEPRELDTAMTSGLLNLATRTARRTATVLEALR